LKHNIRVKPKAFDTCNLLTAGHLSCYYFSATEYKDSRQHYYLISNFLRLKIFILDLKVIILSIYGKQKHRLGEV